MIDPEVKRFFDSEVRHEIRSIGKLMDTAIEGALDSVLSAVDAKLDPLHEKLDMLVTAKQNETNTRFSDRWGTFALCMAGAGALTLIGLVIK